MGRNSTSPRAPQHQPSNEPSNEPAPGLRISAVRDGFRRAGRIWTFRPQDVPVAEFTEEEVAMLREDPSLTVIDIEIPPSAPSARGSGQEPNT